MVVAHYFRTARGTYHNGLHLNYPHNHDIRHIGTNSLDTARRHRLFGSPDTLQKRGLHYFDKGINEYV